MELPFFQTHAEISTCLVSDLVGNYYENVRDAGSVARFLIHAHIFTSSTTIACHDGWILYYQLPCRSILESITFIGNKKLRLLYRIQTCSVWIECATIVFIAMEESRMFYEYSIPSPTYALQQTAAMFHPLARTSGYERASWRYVSFWFYLVHLIHWR
jgi:hypothetical protein